MGNDAVTKPNLGAPHDQYNKRFWDRALRLIELQFERITSAGTIRGSTLNLADLPTSDTGLSDGDVWNDNGVLRIVDSNGVIDRLVSGSYNFKSFTGSFGTNWLAGYYDLADADLNLTQASATGTHGTANASYAAHALLVAGGVGAASGGSGTATITVSGTSINDAGTRTPGDSEVLVTDVTDSAQMAVNTYHESGKKWIGQITYTIAPTDSHTTYNADFNVGLCKYEDFGNIDFTVTGFEVVGVAGANDSSFNIALLKHSADNWVYAATGFVAPTLNDICNMNTDHVTEIEIFNGEDFAYKRSTLDTLINGTLSAPTTSASNGVLVKVTTGANASVQTMDVEITGTLA
jgi:hypothetical protein